MNLKEAIKIAIFLKRPSKWRKLYFGYYTERDIEILKKFLPRKCKILDVGGGIGRLSIPLAKLGHDVTLLDLIKEYLEIAKNRAKNERINLKIQQGDVKKLKFKNNEFDAVIAMRDVLNYCVDDYEKAFSEIVRVCKKKGIIAVSCGSRYRVVLGKGIIKKFGLKLLHDVVIKNKIFPTGEGFNHLNFTVDKLKSLFKKHKIKILKITGDSIVLPIIRSDATKILSKKENVNMIKDIDEYLSKNEENINFFDHIIVIGRK